MTQHTIHPSLPSGFAFADGQQIRDYRETGSINGAAKVCFVRDPGDPLADLEIAVRLRPPRTGRDIVNALIQREFASTGFIEGSVFAVRWYIAQYNAGWMAGRRGGFSKAWDSGKTSHSWDDGYLDAAAGRPKWHLTYCRSHDVCGEA